MKRLKKLTMKKRLGAIPSPNSKKDKKVSSILGLGRTIPDAWMSPWINSIPVLDQGESSCCVACSLANLKVVHELTERQKMSKDLTGISFSPMWIYQNRKNTDWDGEGMIPSEALELLRDLGAVRSKYFDVPFGKYDKDFFDTYEIEEMKHLLEESEYFTVKDFYRCSSDIQVKKAVMDLGAVSVMYPVYKCLYKPDENGEITYKKTRSDGMHQMLILGWDENGYWVLNSWGTSYGKNGLVHIPYEYEWYEAWAVSDRDTPDKAYQE